MPSDKKSLGTTDVQYIWHLEHARCETLESELTQVRTNTISYLIKAHLHSLGLSVGVQVIWLIYRPQQCQPLLTLERWGWPLTVNTPGWKPSPWRWCGPPPVPGASWALMSCLVNPLYGSWEVPIGRAFPAAPQELTPGLWLAWDQGCPWLLAL